MNKPVFFRRFTFLMALILCGAGIAVQAQNDAPRPLYALPAPNVPAFSSSSMVLSSDGRTAFTANMLNDTVSIFDLRQRVTQIEIPVGDDPRSVALTRDGSRLVVTNRSTGTLSVVDLAAQAVIAEYPVGRLPYGVLTAVDNTAFVTLQGEDSVIRLDLATGQILQQVPTPPTPSGLALWGDFLYITHLWTGQVSLIYVPQMELARTVSTGADISLSQSILVDVNTGAAYLPQTRSNTQNTALTFDTTVFPVVNVLNLANMSLQPDSRVALDIADRPVNAPFSVALDPVRDTLYVANAGSDDLSIVNLNTGLRVAHIPLGANPRTVLLSRDYALAYIHNMIDGSLTILDTRAVRVNDVLPVSNLTIPIDVFLGAQLFHSANDPRMSQQQWISCINCHFDGLSDGRVWQGFPGGARNTPVLFGLDDVSSYTWTGDWNELADLELKIRSLQGGQGLIEGQVYAPLDAPHSGLSLDLDTLTAYLLTITPPSQNSQQVEQGAALFNELQCASCHAGAVGSDSLLHDVGTGGEFRTPTLNWLWQSTPYFHDGRANTLLEAFMLPGEHQLIGKRPPDEINVLIEYLLSR